MYCFLQLSSLDESEEEERTRPASKEEEDVDVLQSWMEVGGLPAHPEEEAKGFLAEVNSFPCFSHADFPSPSPICYQLFPHNLGIGLLLAISSFFLGVEIAPPGKSKVGGGTEAGSRGTTVGDRGVGKVQGGCSGI